MSLDDTIRRLHRDAPLTDVHVHPSLKAFLYNRNLWRHYWSGKAFNPFSSRADFKMLEKGGVGVIWAAHHLPERELFKDCLAMRLATMLLIPAYPKLTKGGLFDRVNQMMDALEREVARHPDKAEVAKSAADVERIRREGKLAIVHAIEGAHILEGNVDRLDQLAQRGVAMVTLMHFYRNGIASQADGIPTDMFVRKLCKFKFETGQPPHLTDFGREVLRRMAKLKMIVDVSHCTPQARAEIYQELATSRPVVASHVGVTRYRNDPYNLTDDEIRHIARTGGGIGVIFMTYWLSSFHPDNGLAIITETMQHIHDVTGSWDPVMLGTDFDGFTDPPDDLADASKLPRLTEYLLKRGISEDAVKRILGGNAMRVLKAGWR